MMEKSIKSKLDPKAMLYLSIASLLFSIFSIFAVLDFLGLIKLGWIENLSGLSLLGPIIGIITLVVVFREPPEARSRLTLSLAWIGTLVLPAIIAGIVITLLLGFFVVLPLNCLKSGQC